METYNIKETYNYNINRKTKLSINNNTSPMFINRENIEIKSPILLYEALKYTDHKEMQRRILARDISYADTSYMRKDWPHIRIDVMYYMLKIFLMHYPMSLGDWFRRSRDFTIVEMNKNDTFWGVSRISGKRMKAKGENIRGKLWMDLRSFYWQNDYDRILKVEPLDLPNFSLLGQTIESQVNPAYVSFMDGMDKNKIDPHYLEKWRIEQVYV